jgi:hypothetical protein
VLSIGAVYLTDKYLGPIDQAEAHYPAGYDKKSSAVTFAFDARDVLVNMTSTQSNLGMGANLAAGGQPSAATQQPR